MGRKSHKPVIIGITGSFGTGKTTVAKIFKTLGAAVVDADRLAHKTLKKETTSYKKIVAMFGRRILDRFGRIDRAKLAHLVFQNRRSLKRLCDTIHPIVIDCIAESIKKISGSSDVPAIVIDAPLLIEAGLHNIADYLIVVKTSRTTQVKRAMKKTRLSIREIVRRIKNQIPLGKKIRMADYVIDNEESKHNTKKIVKEIWEKIKNK